MKTFVIETNDLTSKEIAELSTVLRVAPDVVNVEEAFMTSDSARLGIPQASPPLVKLLVTIAGSSVALMTKGALEKAGKGLYDSALAPFVNQLGVWLNSKMSGKSQVRVVVKIYGPDGEIVKEIVRTR